MGKMLVAIASWFMTNFLGRVLAGAGLAIAGTYTIGTFVDYFLNKALSTLNSIPMVGLIGIAGIDKAISILITAVMIKLYLSTLSQSVKIVRSNQS